jgi:hypothetical protein
MLYKEMGRLEPTRRRLLVASHPDRYILDDPNVFPSAIGRSFYESVLPPSSVHLGWSSYAAVWLSRVPTLIPGLCLPKTPSGPSQVLSFAKMSTGRTTFAISNIPKPGREPYNVTSSIELKGSPGGVLANDRAGSGRWGGLQRFDQPSVLRAIMQ